MPIQNIGTLLENIVLVEAARVLISQTHERLALVNAFAMPPLGSWRDGTKYEYQVGFADQVLERVVTLPTARPTSYIALLWRCLQHDRAQGPNGAAVLREFINGKEASVGERTRALRTRASSLASYSGPIRS